MDAPVRSFLGSRARRTRTRRATAITLTLFLLVLAAAYAALGDTGLLTLDAGPAMPMTPPEHLWSRPFPTYHGAGGRGDGGSEEGPGTGPGEWLIGTGPGGVVAVRLEEGLARAVWFDGAGFTVGRWAGEAHGAAVAGTAVVAAVPAGQLPDDASDPPSAGDIPSGTGPHGTGGVGKGPAPGEENAWLIGLMPALLPSGQLLLGTPGAVDFILPLTDGGVAAAAGGPVSPGGTASYAASGAVMADAPVWEERVVLWRISEDNSAGPFIRVADAVLTDEPVLAAAPGWAPPAPAGAPRQLQPPAVQRLLSGGAVPREPAAALLTVKPDGGEKGGVPWSIMMVKPRRDGLEVVFTGEGAPWLPRAAARGRAVWATRGDRLALLEDGRIQWEEIQPGDILTAFPADPRGDRLVVGHPGGWSLFDKGGVILHRNEDTGTKPARLWPGAGRGFFEEADGKLQWYDGRGTPRWALPLAEPIKALAADGRSVVFVDSSGVHRYGWR